MDRVYLQVTIKTTGKNRAIYKQNLHPSLAFDVTWEILEKQKQVHGVHVMENLPLASGKWK